MWKSYARAGLAVGKDSKLLVVLFDEFVVNSSYRRHIAKLAGVDMRSEPDITAISSEGGGSSFTGTKGRAVESFIRDAMSRPSFLEGAARATLDSIIRDKELDHLWNSLLMKFAVK